MIDLKTRVINILTKPAAEWPVVAAESTDVATLYKQYIMPLAAIPAISQFVGQTVFGVYVPILGTIRTSPLRGISLLIVSYVLTLVGVYISALVIEKLAPTFKSSGTTMDALKLVAYASTAAWVAGILHVVPALAVIAMLAGLYSIYLFYLGLPVLMKTPADQVIVYMIVSAVVIILVSFLCAALAGAMTAPRLLF